MLSDQVSSYLHSIALVNLVGLPQYLLQLVLLYSIQENVVHSAPEIWTIGEMLKKIGYLRKLVLMFFISTQWPFFKSFYYCDWDFLRCWPFPMLLHRNKTCLRNINASLTIKKKISKLFTGKQRRTNSHSRITSSLEPTFERFSV